MGVQLLGICACSFEGLVKDGGTAIGNLTLKLVIASEIKRHKLDLYLEKEIIDKNTCDDVMHIYWHSAEFKGN